jgi:hypothetical protein
MAITRTPGKFFLLSLAFISSGPVIGAEVRTVEKVPQCPESYPLEGVTLTKVPAGWIGRVDARFHLQSATVVEGPPEEQGELVPEVGKLKNGYSKAMYNDLNSDPKHRAWLSCNYGYSSELRLFQRLPTFVKHCAMSYKYDSATKLSSLDTYRCE